MEKFIYAVIGLVALVVVTWLSGFFFSHPDFYISFWANLLSDLFVAVVFGYVLVSFTELFKRPALKIVVKQGELYSFENKIQAKRTGEGYEFSFSIAIKNDGSKTLKAGEGYWHLYFFPESTEVDQLGEAVQFVPPNHFRDLIKMPVLPGSFLDVGPEFQCVYSGNPDKELNIYCFLSTEYGYFPKTVRLNERTGLVKWETMAAIPIVLE